MTRIAASAVARRACGAAVLVASATARRPGARTRPVRHRPARDAAGDRGPRHRRHARWPGTAAGRGTSAEGAAIYATKCAQCHGKTGTEGPNDVLVGREPRTGFPFSQDPKLPHTIGNYWPYATTVFDYMRRAMPPTAPGSLSDDEVYALTAFLLHANELIAADAVMDRTTLAAVKMPAREHFVPDARNQTPKPLKPKP